MKYDLKYYHKIRRIVSFEETEKLDIWASQNRISLESVYSALTSGIPVEDILRLSTQFELQGIMACTGQFKIHTTETFRYSVQVPPLGQDNPEEEE